MRSIGCDREQANRKTLFPQRARSLMVRQYGPGDTHVTETETPVPVRAWIVTVHGDDLEVDGDVVAWTPKAVRFRSRDHA